MEPVTRRKQASDALRRLPWAFILVAGFITVWTWPVDSLTLFPSGLDNSWVGAIHVASYEHRDFAHDIVFTYGPWGYWDFPRIVFGTTMKLSLEPRLPPSGM